MKLIFQKQAQQIKTAIVLILVIFSMMPFRTYAQDITTGLIGYWPFCGNANDLSGNNRNGTASGAVLTNDRFGNLNNAYLFDGNDEIFIGSFPSQSEITVSVWIRQDANTGSFQAFVSSTDTYNNDFIHFQTNTFGNIAVYTNQGAKLLPPLSPTPLGTWRHLVITSRSGEIRLYQDNSIIQTLPDTYQSVTSTDSLSFGRGVFYFNRGFIGVIDDVIIYNRALTQTEVGMLYNLNYSLAANGQTSNPSIIDFGNIICENEASKNLQINNSTGNTYNNNDFGFTSGINTRFSISNGPPFNLNQSESHTITIKFNPTLRGIYYDTLLIYNSNCKAPLRIPISATKDSINFAINNTYPDTLEIDLGVVCPGSVKDTTFTIQNKSTISTTLGFGSLAPPFSVEGVTAAKKEEEYEGEK